MRTEPFAARIRVHHQPHRLTTDLVRSLRDRSIRSRLGLFVAEGLRFFHAAVESARPLAGLVVCPKLCPEGALHDIRERADAAGCPTLIVEAGEYGSLSLANEPPGILMVCPQFWEPLASSVGPNDLWIAIEKVRSPGNLGTLMRSAAAFGASGLIVLGPDRDRADPYDPQTVRASMGAIFALRHVESCHRHFRVWSCSQGVRVLGATPYAPDIQRVEMRRPLVLMLGDERQGLSEAQRLSCDGFLRVPMVRGLDSLNVAMAGTVLLYEAFRRQ